MTRREVVRWIVAALVLALAAACGAPNASSPPTVSLSSAIRLGYVANGVAAGVGLALEEQQTLVARGVRAHVQRYGSAENLQQALASGSVDVALGLSAIAAATVANNGRPVAIVAAVQVAEEQIVTPLSSGILTAADLKGKLIGAPLADTVEATLLVSLLSNGYALSPAEYRVRPMTELQRVVALQDGQVDAVVLRGLTVAGLPDARAYRVVANYPTEWRRATKLAAPPYSGAVVMQRALVDGDPDMAARVLAAIADAVRWGRQRPAEAQQLMVARLRMTETNAANYARRWPELFTVALDADTIASVTLTLNQAKAQGLIAGYPADLFAPDIVLRANVPQ